MLLAASVVVAAAWVTAVLLTLGRGLDLTDEGFYLLSYRWWDETTRTFTGAQYLYGPVYEWMDYDVRRLRLFRLVTVLAAHASLARAVAVWMAAEARHRTLVLAPLPAGAAVVAAGGIVYGWLPLSPGYNDVSVLGTVFLGAVVVRVHAAARNAATVPWPWAVTAGVVLVAMLLAKWTSGLLVLLTAVVAVGVIWAKERPRRPGRFAATVSLSAIVSVALLHVLVMPLDQMLPPWWEVTRLVGERSNSPVSLLNNYLVTGLPLVLAVGVALLVGLALHLLLSLRRRDRPRMSWIPLACTLASLAAVLLLSGGLRGSAGGAAGYTAFLAVCLVLVLALGTPGARSAGACHGWPSAGSGATAGFLVMAPVVQALGTGNELYLLAINAAALWCALMVLVTATSARLTTSVAALTAITCSLAAIGWVAGDAIVNAPYRTETFPAEPDRIKAGASGELVVGAGVAAEIHALQEALRSAENPGRPYLAFDEMAGVVLLLDGRPVGEAWYSASDPERTAAGIRADCPTLRAEETSPVLLFSRPATQIDVGALATCGLDFPDDFELLRVPQGPPRVAVYVPVDD